MRFAALCRRAPYRPFVCFQRLKGAEELGWAEGRGLCAAAAAVERSAADEWTVTAAEKKPAAEIGTATTRPSTAIEVESWQLPLMPRRLTKAHTHAYSM